MSAADKIAEANGPERIWAHGNCMGRLGRPLLPGVSSHWATWETRTGDPNHATEYVRADLADAQTQECQEWRKEYRAVQSMNDLLRAANAKMIAERDAQAQEIARLKAIIAKMDANSARIVRDFYDPGVTLSEWTQRQYPELRPAIDAEATP